MPLMAPRRRRSSTARRATRRVSPWIWLRGALPLVIGVILVAVAALGLRAFLLQAAYFTVREVQVPRDVEMPLARTLLGRNLWSIDLSTVQQTTALANPSFKAVRVWRHWPQRIVVEAIPRAPVAQVHTTRYYPVDAESFVLAEGQAAPWADLIIVDGVETRGARLVPGRANASERLTLALEAVSRLQASAALRGHRVQRLDVSNPVQMTLYIDDGLEVRIGPMTEWPRRLPQLRKSLETLAQKQLTPAYLDLRFDEDTIIGPPR